MLFIVIALAWLVAVLLGLTMFRLAALSDRFQARALAEWIKSHRTLMGSTSPDQTGDRADAEARRRTFRATG